MSKRNITPYPGNSLGVSWDRRLCLHVAECGKADDPLFEGDRDPWCEPDRVEPQRVVEVCRRGPSGALNVADADGRSAEQPDSEKACRWSTMARCTYAVIST